MKNVFTMTLVLLLVGLFAATAFAQDGETGKQSKARTANYNEVAADTDGLNARNGNDGGYQEQGGPHDGEGPMGEGSGDGSGSGSGGESGSGGDSAEGGSGSGSGDGSGSSGEKVFVDNDGDGFSDCETRVRKGSQSGTLIRTMVQDGDRTQQRGGGSEGSGDTGEKIFDGADGQGEMSGGSVQGNANDHGPGGDDPAMGDGLGPNEDGVGFGEAEDMEEGDGDMVRNRGKNQK